MRGAVGASGSGVIVNVNVSSEARAGGGGIACGSSKAVLDTIAGVVHTGSRLAALGR
jgi:hypothetical protein